MSSSWYIFTKFRTAPQGSARNGLNDSLQNKQYVSENDKKKRPSWITQGFIEGILRNYESDNSLIVTDIKFTEVEGESGGLASDMFFVSASLGDDKSKLERRSLVFKCHMQGGEHQDVIAKSSIFEREIDMYSKIIPEMTELLEKANPGKYGLLAPKCYYFQYKPTPLLVLEDLRASGFEVPSRLLGLDYDHLLALLKKLAQFHAAGAVLCASNPDYIEPYKKPYFLETEDVAGHWIKCLSSMGRSFANEVLHWPEFGKNISDDINRFIDNMKSTFEKCLWKDDKEFNTLIHCDMWANNLLLRDSSDSKCIEDLRLIDFQLAQYGSPAMELVLVLMLCPSKEVREMPQETLLRDYFNELIEVLTLLEYPSKMPTFDELKEAFDRRACYSFHSACVDLPITLAETDFDYDQYVHEDDKPKRNPLYSNPRYREIMYKLIPFYKAKGIF